MSEFGTFYKEGELDFSKIVPAYQEAFKGWPWYEVSKCVDTNRPQRCASGLSRVALNDTCTPCGNQPNQQAYETSELIERFETLEATRPTSWYIESAEESPALVALAWTAQPAQIAQEKYSDVPEMQDWLSDALGEEPVVWLDEVFADKRVRAEGNLMNFGKMCKGFMSALDTAQLAYRTISPAMIRVAEKNFGVKPADTAPDRRVVLQITGEL